MIDKDYIELINKEIDGVISAEESVKLKDYLEKNPDAQKCYDDYVKLSKMLQQVNAVEPPSNLKKIILNSIRWNKYGIKERKRLFQPLIDALNVKVKHNLAYSFAAGLIVGVFIFALLSHSLNKDTFLDNSELTGTLLLTGAIQDFQTAGKIEDERFGAVEVKFAKNIVLAEIDIAIHQEVKMVIQFDKSDITFAGFRQLHNLANNLEINDDSVILTSKDTTKLLVVFNDKSQTASPMTFKIYSDALVLEGTVYTGTSGE